MFESDENVRLFVQNEEKKISDIEQPLPDGKILNQSITTATKK